MIETARVLFSSEGALIDVSIPVIVVGDIHGQCHLQYVDLQRIFAAVGRPGRTRFLFLGDYVDRGPQSLECICSLVAWKIAYPKRIFLLRGNHEFASVNREYGFYDELAARFSVAALIPGQAMRLWKEFNDLFSIFPFSALIKNRILCMHGGLSPHLESLNDIRNVIDHLYILSSKPIKMPVMEVFPDTLEQDLVWSDPKLDIKGYEPNKLRNVSVAFGEDIVYKTCKRLNLDLIIRAHQVMENGYGFFAGRKLVTIFSAPLYAELNNKGAVIRINAEMVISYVLLNPVSQTTAGKDNFQRSFKDDQRSYRMDELNNATMLPQLQ
uniref:Serine/threonine-protein phosphatase n=1 Tax=Wuchereria bancrofti TaxID=6293 RepID=A0A1I8EEX7_WUCBA